jgi:hypothetical protein
MSEPPEQDEDGFPRNMRGQIDLARADRKFEVLVWDMSLRFLAGDQNVYWNSETRSLITAQQKPGQNTTVTNQLLGIYRTSSQILQTLFPGLTIAPIAPSYDNVRKALACRQAIQAWWRINCMEEVWAKVSRWLISCGNAALHTYWDAGSQQARTEVINAYDLLFEPKATTWEEAKWWACRHIYHRDDLIDSYPDYEEFLKDASNYVPEDSKRKVPRDRLDVWEVYWKDGKHGVLVGGKWLWKGTYPGNLIPLRPIRYTAIPNAIYGMGQLYPLIDLQRQYNRYKNFALDVADATSNPIWLIPFSSNVNKSHITNAAGAVVHYNDRAGGKPERVSAPPIPAHLFEIIGRTLAEMMDVAGIHSTTMGKRQSGVTSGVAMERLQERDFGQFAQTMQSMEQAMVETAKVVLAFWREYMTEEKVVNMMDPAAGRVVYSSLSGENLLDAPEIYVETGTMFRTNIEARESRLLDLHERGLIADPEKLVAKLDLRLDDRDAMQAMKDLALAQNMLDWCKMGEQIEILPGHPVKVIKEVFGEFIESEEYYEAAIKSKQRMEVTGDENDFVMYLETVRRMQYIRDVFVAVTLPMGATPDQFQEASQSKVFPRTFPKPQEAMPALMAANSPQTQTQMTGETVRTQDIGNRVSTARQSFETMRGTPGMTGSAGG